MTDPLGNIVFCFPRISMFPETNSRETKFTVLLGSLSVNCNTVCGFTCNMGCKCIFFFRHHTYKKVDGQIELTEVGPRFEMKGKLYIVRLFSPLSF